MSEMEHGTAARSVMRWLSPLSVALGTGLLAAGYVLDAPEPWAALGALLPALLWVVARTQGWPLAADSMLAAFMALAGLGLWLEVGAGWMVPAAVSGLGAWDLARLELRLANAGHVEDRYRLEARHLVHLLPVFLLGLTLALAGARARLDLGFFPSFLLGVLAIAGLALVVSYLQRDDD